MLQKSVENFIAQQKALLHSKKLRKVSPIAEVGKMFLLQ